MTNSAYGFEYDQFLDAFAVLDRPAFTVTGNHDAIGAGPALFKKAFGASNFVFESASTRFVFFHSANLEDPAGFDPAWLKAQVDSSAKPVVVFSHVQLRDSERFFGADAAAFDAVITDAKTRLILNGHNHSYDFNTDNGTVMLQCPRVEGGQWLMLEIQGSQLTVTRMESGAVQSATFKN